MNIPQFPDSKEITIEDKPLFDGIFKANPPALSVYTFTNLFAWCNAYQFKVSAIGDAVIVYHFSGETIVALEPLGTSNHKAVAQEVYNRVEGREVVFQRIHASIAAEFEADPHFVIEMDRNHSDYLYRSSDLIQLIGRNYDAKRNFINRIKAQKQYEYVEITKENALECEEFAARWCRKRLCKTNESMHKEICAVYEMLAYFDQLQIVGGAIRMDGEIVAFSLGEALNPQTLVIHAEKADNHVNGLYQLINNEFLIHEASNYEFVNREQDLGIPGLRKAKQSYHPIKLVEAYTIKHTM